MKMSSRKAFTMIELIFVIVIIGILAAVAIPKLAATRDDAKVANIIANTRIVIGDMKAFYTSQGGTIWSGAKNGAVTDVPLQDVGGALQSPTGQDIAGTGTTISSHYLSDAQTGANDCIRIDANSTDINVTINSTTGVICGGVGTDPVIIAITGSIHRLGGVTVVR